MITNLSNSGLGASIARMVQYIKVETGMSRFVPILILKAGSNWKIPGGVGGVFSSADKESKC